MKGSKFVSGETLTYVDFMFWEILDHMFLFGMVYVGYPKCLFPFSSFHLLKGGKFSIFSKVEALLILQCLTTLDYNYNHLTL